MALQEKYAELINAAHANGVANLVVRTQDNVLYIDGIAPSTEVKEKLWNIYAQLDPDFRSADAVMNIGVVDGDNSVTGEATEYTVVSGDSLSKIGAKLGKNWKEIYDLNREKIGKNPDYIQAGWVLQIPA